MMWTIKDKTHMITVNMFTSPFVLHLDYIKNCTCLTEIDTVIVHCVFVQSCTGRFIQIHDLFNEITSSTQIAQTYA